MDYPVSTQRMLHQHPAAPAPIGVSTVIKIRCQA